MMSHPTSAMTPYRSPHADVGDADEDQHQLEIADRRRRCALGAFRSAAPFEGAASPARRPASAEASKRACPPGQGAAFLEIAREGDGRRSLASCGHQKIAIASSVTSRVSSRQPVILPRQRAVNVPSGMERRAFPGATTRM